MLCLQSSPSIPSLFLDIVVATHTERNQKGGGRPLTAQQWLGKTHIDPPMISVYFYFSPKSSTALCKEWKQYYSYKSSTSPTATVAVTKSLVFANQTPQSDFPHRRLVLQTLSIIVFYVQAYEDDDILINPSS